MSSSRRRHFVEHLPRTGPPMHTLSSSSPLLRPLPPFLRRPPPPAFLPAAIRRRRPPPSDPIRAILSSPDPAKWGGLDADLDMVRNRDGVWTAKPKRVVVLWDLDNKPPRGPPYDAAMALRRVARRFGGHVDISAYANRHAFVHVPSWVREQRSERRQLDVLERRGVVAPAEDYVCSVCGRKCRSHLDLRKHFKSLHQREREKKLARLRSLKGKKKRQKYKERFISGNTKYEEAERELIVPKIGYGLAGELRRAGVFVKTVEDKPQAADAVLKKQIQHSMSSGVDWLFLVSDDSDFLEMLRRAREFELGTVVIGDTRRALGRQADIWVPWVGVENGEVDDEMLRLGRREEEAIETEEGDGLFATAEFNEGNEEGVGDVDAIVDEIVINKNSGYSSLRVSAFSEDEGVDGEGSNWEENSEDESDEEDDYFLL